MAEKILMHGDIGEIEKLDVGFADLVYAAYWFKRRDIMDLCVARGGTLIGIPPRLLCSNPEFLQLVVANPKFQVNMKNLCAEVDNVEALEVILQHYPVDALGDIYTNNRRWEIRRHLIKKGTIWRSWYTIWDSYCAAMDHGDEEICELIVSRHGAVRPAGVRIDLRERMVFEHIGTTIARVEHKRNEILEDAIPIALVDQVVNFLI